MAPDDRPKTALVTEDSFAALVRAFKRSPKFLGYSAGTQDTWGRELDHMAHPDCLGLLSLETIRPSLVQAYFDGLTGRPGKQGTALSAIKQLERWAVVRDLLPRQITLGVEIERSSGGHMPWTDEQVERAERHARPDIARAITLASNTGQRGSDLIRIRPTDHEIYNGVEGINVNQKKTGKQVWVPVTSPLVAALKSWERRPGPYLTRPDGLPWTRAGLTHAWSWERDNNRNLEELKRAGLVLHGLRATACVRLRRSGAQETQIAAMVGMSEQMVTRYCRFSAQKENAMAAVVNLERTISERNSRLSTKSGR